MLELTGLMTEVFKTDTGEKLINALKEKRPHFHVEEAEGPYQYHYHHDKRKLRGEGTDELGLAQILLEVFGEYFGSHPELSQVDFVSELKKEESVEQYFNDQILVRGAPHKLKRMMEVLEKISSYPLGKKLYQDMKTCGHGLLIYDDKHALGGGGYTAAVIATSGIFEGRGTDAYIRFRFDQPLEGAHKVRTKEGFIPFTYIDNMFHELVHAKHIMCGTMSKTGAEAQAIAEENDFRKERPQSQDWPARDSSQYEEGQQTWFGLFLSED